MPISVTRLSKYEAVYTHVPDTADPPVHIATDRLVTYMVECGLFKPERIVITDQFVRLMLQGNLGVEENHLKRLPEAALEVPCLLIDWENGTHTLADGNHRVTRRAMRGDRFYPAYIAPKRIWSRFVVTDFPDIPKEDWDDFCRNAQIRGPRETWRM